jgi:predicted TIM-barrel fold metal-dependent hydrolase
MTHTYNNNFGGKNISIGKFKDRSKKDAKKNINMKIIDVHRHCLPKPSSATEGAMRTILKKRIHWREIEHYAVTTFKGISSIVYPDLMDIDAQVRGQDEAGITKSILSFSMALETMVRALFMVPEDKLARRLNDATIAMVDRYPDKLDFMAIVNPFNKNSIKECERCIDTLGAKGINISTSWDGKYLDSPELNHFWEFVQERDVAVFLHPPQVPIGCEYMDAYKLEEMLGRPFDTTMTVARMIYAGVFDRFPKLNIVLPHMGGGLPMIAGRLDFGYRLGYKGLPKDQIPICKRKPSEYFRTNLYVDTMGFVSSGIKHVIDLFGVDRVLFGSDYAAVPISPREHVEIVKSLGLSHEDEEKILWKNAYTLFKIT